MIKQPSVENCLEMLGFNPYDTEYDFGVIRKFDKIKAKFVLDNFNNNNREINLGQRVNLRKNIELNMTDKNDMSTGWIKNGETMSFATDPDRGTNITEYQHRLEEIVYNDLIVPVPDSGVPAAIGYAEQIKKNFELGIIRNHWELLGIIDEFI